MAMVIGPSPNYRIDLLDNPLNQNVSLRTTSYFPNSRYSFSDFSHTYMSYLELEP